MNYTLFLAKILLVITGLGYPGPVFNNDQKDDSIKIGLLIQENDSEAAVRGAELAIRKANLRGGPGGRKFSLVVRSMEGPWGTGSKQAVDLIFNEKVWALAGSHDGRNAHLVEQAATKSIVPYISAWSSDPTLTQAFVPWFFNCVPTDIQQSAELINSIYIKHKFSKTIVVAGTGYDARITSGSYLKAVKASGRPDPDVISAADTDKDADAVEDKIISSGPQCVVLFCEPRLTEKIIRNLVSAKSSIPVFSSLMAFDENELEPSDMSSFDNKLRIASGEWTGQAYSEFRNEYLKLYSMNPGMAASFSYDAVCLLTEAIRKAGKNDRELIQKSLQEINYKGATGNISFDDKGNRKGDFSIMILKEGVPFKPE